jgi:hypothetical protein
MALGFAAGLADEAAHSSFWFEHLQLRLPQNREVVDYATKAFGAFCKPPQATVQQVTDVFCAYLNGTPKDRDQPAALLFHAAMKQAWPCG